MTGSNGFDRRLTAWLDEQAPMREPDDLLEATSGRIARTRRLPGWAIPERWLPMQTTAKLGAIPRTAIALVTLGLLLVVFTALAIGSGSNPGPKLPPPFGLARNGLITFDSDGDIWVSMPDGSGRSQLTSGPEIDVSPIWSPDGTRIAFWSWPQPSDPADAPTGDIPNDWANLAETETASLVVIDTSGRDRRVLSDGIRPTSGSVNNGPAWATDSRRVGYARVIDAQGTTAATQIDIVSIEGGRPTLLVSPGDFPAFGPDGLTIAYRVEGVGVFLVSADGTGSRQITRVSGSGADLQWPRWSPDGTDLTFATGNSTGPGEIWVVSASGGDDHPITSDSSDDWLPDWSPSGDRIAFGRAVPGENVQRFVLVAPDGSEQVVLPEPKWVGVTNWSPDGTKVIGSLPAETGFAGSAVAIVDTSGREPLQTISAPGNIGNANWQRLALP